MAVKSSGALSITTDIVGEFGGTAPHSISEYVRGGSLVPDGPSANADIPTTTSSIQWSDYYGSINQIDLSDVATPTTINGESTLQEITVSTYISSGGSLVIPTGWWIWSDSTSTPALIIDVPCTITNNGYIIGKGGAGSYSGGDAGGPAIKINSGVSGVTIINNSGYYIAGGGGGGGGGVQDGYGGAGGGGAGGGAGGGSNGGSGGIINASGGNSDVASYGGTAATGGGSGGGGGGGDYDGSDRFAQSGAGGGRILPGTGGSAGSTSGGYTGGAGGSAGNAGSNASGALAAAGGGGGWGAAGGSGTTYSGGAGGKAIDDSGETYTLTNNGTIYGAT